MDYNDDNTGPAAPASGTEPGSATAGYGGPGYGGGWSAVPPAGQAGPYGGYAYGSLGGATQVDASQAPRRERRAARRGSRRFGALALSAALLAGGGAGAVVSVLLQGGSNAAATASSITTPAAQTVKASGGSAVGTSGLRSTISSVEPALVDIYTTGVSSQSSPLFGNGLNPFGSGQVATKAAGTGMILNSSGLVLTNAHVIAGATNITVAFDGKTSTHTAKLVGEDAAKDVALIQVKGVSGLPTVTLGNSSNVQVGDAVLAIGNALDLQKGGFTVSNGIISGLNRAISTNNGEHLSSMLQTDAAISSGDSGGPLVNASGHVVGMDTAAATSSSVNTASNIGFAIPSNEIKSLIPRLEKGNIGTPTVGSSSSSGSSSSGSNPYGSFGSGSDGSGSFGSGSGGFGSSGGLGSSSSGVLG